MIGWEMHMPAGMETLALLLKVTLLLIAAGAVAARLRHRAAAVRHFVWLAGIAGALAVTTLTPLAPRLAVPLPGIRELLAPPATSTLPPAPTTAGAPRSGQALNDAPAPGAQPAGTGGRRAATSPFARLLAQALVVVWLTGFAGVLAWSALGRIALAQLASRAIAVDATEWHARVHGLAFDRRGVRLARSRDVGAPLMFGWRRPLILLPEESRAWPESRLRDALLHELAHVRRGDYLTQSLGTLACAVFWFHPLAWHAAARLRSEGEHACD